MGDVYYLHDLIPYDILISYRGGRLYNICKRTHVTIRSVPVLQIGYSTSLKIRKNKGTFLMSISRIFQRIKNLFIPQQRHDGVIKFFDRKKRFGFIIADQQEYFFHAAAIRGSDYRFLQDGVKVNFVLVSGRKGMQADDIIIIGPKRLRKPKRSD
jgi:CspA family cold shock protein